MLRGYLLVRKIIPKMKIFVLTSTCTSGIVLSKGVRLYTPLTLNHTLNHNLTHTLNHTLNHNLTHTLNHTLNHTINHNLTHTLNHNLNYTLSHTPNPYPNPQLYLLKLFLYSLEFGGGGVKSRSLISKGDFLSVRLFTPDLLPPEFLLL